MNEFRRLTIPPEQGVRVVLYNREDYTYYLQTPLPSLSFKEGYNLALNLIGHITQSGVDRNLILTTHTHVLYLKASQLWVIIPDPSDKPTLDDIYLGSDNHNKIKFTELLEIYYYLRG